MFNILKYILNWEAALKQRFNFLGGKKEHQNECSPSDHQTWITGLKDLQSHHKAFLQLWFQWKVYMSCDGLNVFKVPFSQSSKELQHCKRRKSICCIWSKVHTDSDNLYSFPEKPVKQSSSVLVSRQHLTLPVFPPCRLGLHFLDSPTDCWDVQRSWKYFKYTVVSCSRAPLGLCQWAANMQPVGAVCRLIHAIQQDRVGAAPKVCLPVRPWRKTPPVSLIATTRRSPEALSNGGLVVRAGNLLLFIDW